LLSFLLFAVQKDLYISRAKEEEREKRGENAWLD
jgi:hypothetical protein